MNAAGLFVRCLKNEDVDYIFGVPGPPIGTDCLPPAHMGSPRVGSYALRVPGTRSQAPQSAQGT